MQQSTPAGKIIAILFVVIIVPFAIYAFWHQVKNNSTELDQVKQQIIEPYRNALQQEQWEFSYQSFTTKDYRERVSLEEFIKAQQENKEAFGTVKNIYTNVDILNELSDPSSGTFYRVTVTYEASKDNKLVVLELKKEQGKFKIDRTYLAIVGADLLQEQIF
ncbi:MAG: hypothetical protein GW939_03695 [Candidatus Magasanikbacteria bacterium]|uniref:DUF4878 domain-containing protein n=1 Tax=Candidatus Magasanikbacteria bacterium CG10_big_fil_rev_8_21_14_0_10_38_6 TaxID=1974647 RepID=A0A2M6P000_9BACT|nr:hypothetical protein [Candidatus Magasanikbacteria bacterium]NCS71813.1 hypothetical protein [Candidatus Magasanikbacteria bacterium]PIR77021.1 MAG: hypothetical protein COU30_04740 [Candidatus Magasanikbacteria bacterium CG10_big_fil_rev_8_21_14_0_10_38_6]